MSDFYDSLEDGEEEEEEEEWRNKDRKSFDFGPVKIEGGSGRESRRGRPKNVKSNEFSNGPKILPKIENRFNGKRGFELSDVDSGILSHQGLQMNKDGSFSRSSKWDFEQLPFVTREYQNLLFQRKQSYQLDKTMSRFVDESENRRKSKEKIRKRSLSCAEVTGSKELFDRNLTDAMKQKLLEKHELNSPGKRPDDLLRRVKPIVNFLKNSGHDLSGNDLPFSKTLKSVESFPKISGDPSNDCPKTKMRNFSGGKSGEFEIFKNRLDASVSRIKPRLSYLERHQKEMGFNPLFLRNNYPKCLSDTNRSTYGDSIASDLSEISSRALTTGKIIRDDGEESFYRDLIEKDKALLAQRSSRSDGQLQTKKLIDFVALDPLDNHKELKHIPKKTTKSSSRGRTKLTAIDLASSEVDTLPQLLKKNCHFCSLNGTSSMTKTELALKARAYGFMANARNVFRWKNQSNESKKKWEKFRNGFGGMENDQTKIGDFDLKENEKAFVEVTEKSKTNRKRTESSLPPFKS